MALERPQDARAIAHAALQRSGAQRDRFLDAACPDPATRAEVEAIIFAATASAELRTVTLEATPTPPASNPPSHQPADDDGAALIGRRLGAFRIHSLIDAGGMGLVYQAQQQNPSRVVALKVVRPGLLSRAALKRFELEAQVLARLRHPGIAQIYQAGVHEPALDEGLPGPVPYMAMEYIAGARTLTDHARAAALSLRDRLELFARVGDAMQHAHQRGVIHRDLKPANILVGEDGQPKVIDFGVARADDANATIRTQVGQLIGTVQYMSPEQFQADPDDLDVRSDVYSLGLILYELVCDRRPYDLARTSLGEAARIVREEPPARPRANGRRLDRDLETIIAKALEKPRERRYQSAGALADDLRRYLRHEPILARRTGPLGRAARWARRHRAVATIAGVAALLLVSVSALLIARVLAESARANRNLHQAEQNLAYAQQNFALLREILESADPDQATGELTVREMLEAATRRLDTRPPESPAAEADVRAILGGVLRKHGSYDRAIDNLERAVRLRERASPEPTPALADALHELAAAHWWNGQYARAIPLYERSLDMRRALHGDSSEPVASSLTHLAACYLKLARYPEAEDLYRRALDMRQALHGPEHEHVAASLNNLAKCYMDMGDHARAEPLFRRALDMIRRLKGDTDHRTAFAHHNLAACLLEMGRHDEAAEHFQRAIAIRTPILGEHHHLTAGSRLGLARAMLARGQTAQVERTAREVLDSLRHSLKPGHPDLAEPLTLLGQVLIAQGRAAEAEPLLREAIDIARAIRPPVPWQVADAQGVLAECLAAQGRHAEAEPILLEASSTVRSALGDRSRPAQRALQRLIDFYRAQGLDERAAPYAEALRHATGG